MHPANLATGMVYIKDFQRIVAPAIKMNMMEKTGLIVRPATLRVGGAIDVK